MATEKELREKLVKTAESYKGAKEGGDLHREIIRIFNKVKPDSWAMTMKAPWCAAFASAMAIEAFGKKKAKKYFPLSANCGTIISKAKRMKIWKEKDSYVPDPGDWLLYDWDDSGKGNCKGSPDHVGIVVKVTSKQITVIEGNYKDSVKERKVKVDGRYIRGFVIPDYAKMAK